MKRFLQLLILLAAMAGCGKEAEDETQAMNRSGDPQRGKSVYLSNCAACHNSDPSKEGSVGPAIKGSNRELLIARVLKASYPPDYKPKRQTRAMPAQPYLKSAIPDLVAFLNQP